MSSHTSIFFAGHTLSPPRHVYRGKAMPLYTGGWMLMPVRGQRTTSCLVSQTLSFSVPPPLDDIRTPAEFIRVLQRLASFLLSPIGTYRRAKGIVIFVFFGRLPLRQPTACRCKHGTQCPSSRFRAANKRGWLTAAIKWPSGKLQPVALKDSR